MKFSPIKTTYFPITGGVNFVTPALSLSPGNLINGRNYEEIASVEGAKRIDGFERFDGRDLASTFPEETREAQRALILAVPGINEVRGVVVYKGNTYAFRDIDATYAGMYKATSGGWVLQADPTIGGKLAAGGKYEFDVHNFYGDSDSEELYFVSGVDFACAFDGTDTVRISTGAIPDTPEHVNAHKSRLWLSFAGGQYQCSLVTDPTDFTTLGVATFGTGDSITKLATVAGGVLAILCRNSSFLLYGNNSEDWQQNEHSATTGCLLNTYQDVGQSVYMDDRGVTTLEATAAYGDFISNVMGQAIKPFIDQRKTIITDSSFSKEKNQYRLFFGDNTGVYMTINQRSIISSNIVEFPVDIFCTFSGEDIEGNEVMYFGGSDGYVYRNDSGTSFDGAVIPAYMRLAYYHYKTPQIRKRFRKLTAGLNLDATPETNLKIITDFDYGGVETPQSRPQDAAIYGGGSLWGIGVWGEFQWSGQAVGEAEAYIDGYGKNMSILISSESATEPAHIIHSLTITYSALGVQF